LLHADRVSSHEEEVKLLRQIRSFLAFATSNRNEGDFLDRYFEHNQPFFPVLPTSPSQTFDRLPPGLQALILAEALANFPGFRAAGREAQRIAKESRIAEKMLDAQPKLSSIAASLVELNMGMDPRGDFLLLSKVRQVALSCLEAQSLTTMLQSADYRTRSAARSSHRLSRLESATSRGEVASNTLMVDVANSGCLVSRHSLFCTLAQECVSTESFSQVIVPQLSSISLTSRQHDGWAPSFPVKQRHHRRQLSRRYRIRLRVSAWNRRRSIAGRGFDTRPLRQLL